MIASKKLSRTLFPKPLVVNDLQIFDKKAIAENFNNFFSEIGPKFGKTHYKSRVKWSSSNIKNKKSSGYDEISSDIIKHISPSVFETLRYIFNLSTEKGIFPDQLKIAKVTPLFKKAIMR